MPSAKASKNGQHKRKRFYRELGKRIKEKRQKKGFSQQGIASFVGLSRTSLTNIEKGRQNLLLHTFVDLADALETSVNDLLPEKPKASEDIQKKLDSVAPEFREFVKLTIGQAEHDEHNNNTSKSNTTPNQSRHQKSTR